MFVFTSSTLVTNIMIILAVKSQHFFLYSYSLGLFDWSLWSFSHQLQNRLNIFSAARANSRTLAPLLNTLKTKLMQTIQTASYNIKLTKTYCANIAQFTTLLIFDLSCFILTFCCLVGFLFL